MAQYDSEGNLIIPTLGISTSNLGSINTRTNLSQGYDNVSPKSTVYAGGVAPVGTDTSSASGVPTYLNPYTEYGNTEGLFGLTNNTWNNLGQAAGLAGTAYSLYDNILGNKAEMYKLQKSAMKQNMANIAEDRANHQKFVGNFGGAFNTAFKPAAANSGLAASATSSATPKY